MHLLTAKEAADLIGFKRATLYKYASLNKIPYYTIGNGPKASIRFVKDDILNLIKKSEPNIETNKLQSTIQAEKIKGYGIYKQVLDEFKSR